MCSGLREAEPLHSLRSLHRGLRECCQSVFSVHLSLHASLAACTACQVVISYACTAATSSECSSCKQCNRRRVMCNAEHVSLCAGKVAAPDLATMDAQRVRELTAPPPEPSATPHPGLQQELDNTPAGPSPPFVRAMVMVSLTTFIGLCIADLPRLGLLPSGRTALCRADTGN